jgi:hypothetical protein
MAPVTDHGYAAAKQKRYRERLATHTALVARNDSRRPSDYLFRAAAVYARAHITKTNSARALQELFGHDPVTELIMRGATASATTTDTSWASAIAREVIDDTIAAVASLSAAADVLDRGTRVNFNGAASIRIPGRAFAANNADAGQWVAEGAAIPVRALNFTEGLILEPRKLAVIVTFTRDG